MTRRNHSARPNRSFVVTGYVVAFPNCRKCRGSCRLVLVRTERFPPYYARSLYDVRNEVAVWATRADAERAARAFLGRRRDAVRVVRVGRWAK